MAAADKNMAFWELYETDGFMDVQRYLKVVADFVATGEVPGCGERWEIGLCSVGNL